MNTIAKVLYTTEVTTTGGRSGRSTSDDGLLDVPLARPGTGRATNPEQLLGAGWSACFQSALQLIGARNKVDVAASVVKATVMIGAEEDGGFALKVALKVIIPGLALDEAQSLADQAHLVCPYSKATRGNIAVDVLAVAA